MTWIILIRKKNLLLLKLCPLTRQARRGSSCAERIWEDSGRREGRGAGQRRSPGLTQSPGSHGLLMQPLVPHPDPDAPNQPRSRWVTGRWGLLLERRSCGRRLRRQVWGRQLGSWGLHGINILFLQLLWGLRGVERGTRAFPRWLQVPQDGKITVKPLPQKAGICPALLGCRCWNG